MKTFIHIGAPKAASSSLQHFFHENNKINFLGIIRDHENISFGKLYNDNSDFHLYCRYKNNSITNAKKLKKKLSKEKINVISDEDFFTSIFANFKKKIDRIIKIFPDCEFIVVLRDPSETLISWHNFYIRGNKNIQLSLRDYVNDEKTKLFVDLINYKKRISYFESLKKNKFHIIDFNIIKKNKTLSVFNEIFQLRFSEKKDNISLSTRIIVLIFLKYYLKKFHF